MRTGTPLEWSRAFDVGPDDLPDEIRRLLRAAEVIDAAAATLRMLVHTAPDHDLDAAARDLERRSGVVADLLRQLLNDVLKELR